MREGEPREREEFHITSKVLDVEQSCQQDLLMERKERKEGTGPASGYQRCGGT